MKTKIIQAYVKPEGIDQEVWEKEFLNRIAFDEMKRRGLTDRQISDRFDIRLKSILRFKRDQGIVSRRKVM